MSGSQPRVHTTVYFQPAATKSAHTQPGQPPEHAFQSGSDAHEEEPAGGAELDPMTKLSYAEVMQESGHGESACTCSRFPRRSIAGHALHMTNICQGELLGEAPEPRNRH